MKSTTIALAAGTAVAGAALSLRALMRHRATAAFSRVKAGHALATLGKHIAPLLTATLTPQAARPTGMAAQIRR